MGQISKPTHNFKTNQNNVNMGSVILGNKINQHRLENHFIISYDKTGLLCLSSILAWGWDYVI